MDGMNDCEWCGWFCAINRAATVMGAASGLKTAPTETLTCKTPGTHMPCSGAIHCAKTNLTVMTYPRENGDGR